MEEEGGSGLRSCYRSRKNDTKVSKYISEVLQKHRLLDRKRHGTSPYHRSEKNALSMTGFIEKHINTGQIVIAEDEWPTICNKSEVISHIVFGRPIIKSFSYMLSEYHSKKYGGVLRCILYDGLSSSFGPIAKGDCGVLAKWFHLNYKACHKDDKDGSTEKHYFAEVIVFKFKFAGPLFCIVHTCLPVEHDDSGTCQCLFPECDSRIGHPSQNAYLDADLRPVSSSSLLWSTATRLFHDHFWYVTSTFRAVWLAEPSWPYGPIPVDKLNIKRIPYCDLDGFKIDLIRRGGISGAEAETEYLYRKENTLTDKMSKHIPVPKTFLLSEVKRQSNVGPAEIQKRALAITKHIEDRKKPRMRESKTSLLFKDLSMELTKFWRETNGYDLEALNGSIINEMICPEHRDFSNAKWIHVNFNAKRKDADSENLYFAEVVKISHLFQKPIYKIRVCVPVDKNHPSGKCQGICNIPNICHPSQGGSYVDDTSKINLSEFSEWIEGPNTFEEALCGRDLAGVCCMIPQFMIQIIVI